jgi:hypothetical protein
MEYQGWIVEPGARRVRDRDWVPSVVVRRGDLAHVLVGRDRTFRTAEFAKARALAQGRQWVDDVGRRLAERIVRTTVAPSPFEPLVA